MKRWVPVLVSVAVLLSACGSSPKASTTPGEDAGSVKEEQPSGGKEEPAVEPAADDELTTVDQLTDALAADHASADWYPYLRGMTLETYIGASVLVLHVTWDDTDTDVQAKSDRTRAMLTALQDYNTPCRPMWRRWTGRGTSSVPARHRSSARCRWLTGSTFRRSRPPRRR